MKDAFLNHINADPNHKMGYYMGHFASQPGMDDLMKNLSSTFPEVAKNMQDTKVFHDAMAQSMNSSSNSGLKPDPINPSKPAPNQPIKKLALGDETPLVPSNYSPQKNALPVPYSIPLSGPFGNG